MALGRTVVLMDVDGTLANPSKRMHLRPQGDDALITTNWIPFVEEAIFDDPIKHMIEVSNTLAEQHWLYILTSRCELHRGTTLEWLHKHGVRHDALLMRKRGDSRPCERVKEDIVNELIAEGSEIILAVDDHEPNVRMFAAKGIPALQAFVC